MRVPFVDLYAQYLTIKKEIDAAIGAVIGESAFIRGPYVQAFEDQFASAIGIKACVSCANGTDSLFAAMHGLGVSPGHEVIAPAHSWISTTETITLAGGRVVFCDTDATTYTIDPAEIETKITPYTVGIIPVHLFGQPAQMDAIMTIAMRHGLWVLEDCAQAHMARYKGQIVGTFGTAASFSFYPGKNLGAMGDAGAVVTNDSALAERIAMFARHGGLTKGVHKIEGINSRLDGLQAAVLSVKLPYLARWTRRRQEIAARYNQLLAGTTNLSLPHVAADREHVYHLYVVQHAERDALASHLNANGIQTSINYPIALPFLPAYERYGFKPEDFPNAFASQSRILSLPLFPEMTEEQIEFVAACVKGFAQ